MPWPSEKVGHGCESLGVVCPLPPWSFFCLLGCRKSLEARQAWVYRADSEQGAQNATASLAPPTATHLCSTRLLPAPALVPDFLVSVSLTLLFHMTHLHLLGSALASGPQFTSFLPTLCHAVKWLYCQGSKPEFCVQVLPHPPPSPCS